MVETLFDPWAQGVLQRAFAEVVLLGVIGGALGCWVIFYELSYSAESLAHALFPGLVLAALVGLPILVGGAIGILAAALAVALAGRAPEIGRDTGVAVVVTALLGLGALLALSSDSPPGLEGLLFGDILGISDTDLALAAGLAVAVGAALWLSHWRLLAVGFDRTSARAVGVPPLVADVAVLVLLALAILVAVQGLGNLLVVAVLIGPAATARLLVHRMAKMIALASAIAVAAGIGGIYLSYYAGTAAGASIASVMVATYLVAAAASATVGRAARIGA